LDREIYFQRIPEYRRQPTCQKEHSQLKNAWDIKNSSNRQYINEDNDQEPGKKTIYFFIQYNNQPVGIEKIAEKLNVSKKAVEEKIEKIY
jgi:Holliday junction resolvasome RuvABC ATP-dependent DNA helicase subunit